MTQPNPLNIKPLFRADKLPCDGQVGDVLIISPLEEGEPDFEPRGVATIWVCTRASYDAEGLPAVWIRLQAEGYASCDYPVPPPPQDIPHLSHG